MATTLKEDMIKVIESLINESISRQEASEWASKIIDDDDHAIPIEKKVWEILEGVGAADLISTDRPYLYNKIDFKEWLASLKVKEPK